MNHKVVPSFAKFCLTFLLLINIAIAGPQGEIDQLSGIARAACVRSNGGVDVNLAALTKSMNAIPVSEEHWRGKAAARWYALPDRKYLKTFKLRTAPLQNVLIFELFDVPPQDSKGIASYGIYLNESCVIVDQRTTLYGQDGKPLRLEGPDLRANAVLLNPSVPHHSPMAGIPVALIDSGVNYLLPQVSSRIMRTASGEIIGKDFTDDDKQPYDEDFILGSLWFPLRHGTSVASVLLEANRNIIIAPYRHPATRPQSYAQLISDIDRNNIRIANISIGGGPRSDWQAFYESARKAENILFIISAGNEGLDLDKNPRFPASFNLPNAIVVTALARDGSILQSSNYGKNSVDIAIKADKLQGFSFDGRPAFLSGTSYAAPLISALAARILSNQPKIPTQELKRQILQNAKLIPDNKYTKHGEIQLP